MIARISSPFDDEVAAGCTGTACGANATLGAGVWLLLLVNARGSALRATAELSSGSTRDCGVGSLGGGGSGIGRGRGAGVGAGAGAAGIRAFFFGSSLGSVGGDLERTMRGTFSLAADGGAGGAGGGWGAEELDDATDGGCSGAFWPLCASIWAIMEACASSTIFLAAMFFSSSTCPIAWFCCAMVWRAPTSWLLSCGGAGVVT